MKNISLDFFQNRASASHFAAEWLTRGPLETADGNDRPRARSFRSTKCKEQIEPHGFEVRRLTADGLTCLARNASTFDATVLVPSPFSEHFSQAVTPFAATGTPEKIEDPAALAFSLLEDLVVFFRERFLKQGCMPLENVESRVLDYFETCGEWCPTDGTLVSDWYYVQIPARVFQYLLKQLSSPPAYLYREKTPRTAI